MLELAISVLQTKGVWSSSLLPQKATKQQGLESFIPGRLSLWMHFLALKRVPLIFLATTQTMRKRRTKMRSKRRMCHRWINLQY